MSLDEEIRRRLATLQPTRVELADESGRHAGHAGSSGGAHFRLTIVSGRFDGQPTLQRHRMVYDALGDLMRRQVHAMSIIARTPDETL